MLNDVMLNEVVLNDILLSAIMQKVVMLSVIMVIVVVPKKTTEKFVGQKLELRWSLGSDHILCNLVNVTHRHLKIIDCLSCLSTPSISMVRPH
jgi:hypothetical protein